MTHRRLRSTFITIAPLVPFVIVSLRRMRVLRYMGWSERGAIQLLKSRYFKKQEVAMGAGLRLSGSQVLDV